MYLICGIAYATLVAVTVLTILVVVHLVVRAVRRATRVITDGFIGS